MLLRAAAAWAFTAVYWTVVGLLNILACGRLSSGFKLKAVRCWGWTTFSIIGIRLEILNASTMDERAPRILIFNHQSALDMIWMAAILPPAALALGKKEIIFVPFVNIAWWALNFLRVDRDNPREVVQSLSLVAREITENRRSFIISPEGTRTRDGALMPFKRGAFRIAQKSGAPLCPVVISGAFELMPRNRLLPRRGVLRLSYLPPIETRGLSPSGINELAERARRLIDEAYQKQRALP